MTQILQHSEGSPLSGEQIQAIGSAARACKIIAFPTDTVYGIGSTGLIKAAARRIYQIKERPSIKPLPILVHSTEEARKWVEWTEVADSLARRFWPGPLTLVLKPTAQGRLLTFAEYQTVAIRVPNHPLLLKIIEASSVPWVSTSANRSDQPALSDGAEVARQFAGAVDYIIDAGRLPGVESTLIDATQTEPRVLREGAVKLGALT